MTIHIVCSYSTKTETEQVLNLNSKEKGNKMKSSFETYNALGSKSYQLNISPPSARYHVPRLGQQVHLPR
jgi:hypothetical protein